MSQFFTSGGQSIGASALASVLPMNIQDWFPFGLTGSNSLKSKGFSRVFSNTTVQKHQFFGAQPSLWPSSHIHTCLLDKPQLWPYGPGLFTHWGPADHSHGVLTKGTCNPRLAGVSGDCVLPHLRGSKLCAEGDHIHKTKKKGRIHASATCV